MTRLLASIRDIDEARIALRAPIGILDLKEPSDGALGALKPDAIKAIVELARGQCAVSATVGDLPPDADILTAVLDQWLDCGVDYIKLGFFEPRHLEVYPAVLRQYAERTKLIGVLFADRIQCLEGPCRLLKRAGCSGVMLDTADKNGTSVCQLLERKTLEGFVAETRKNSLLCGIAGSLRKEDIPALLPLAPDYLGFRTALCEQRQRNGKLSCQALQGLLELFDEGLAPLLSSRA